MYTVVVEGSTAMWHRHANQLRVRSVILPSSSDGAGGNSNTTTLKPKNSLESFKLKGEEL